MKHLEIISDNRKPNSSEKYIDFLSASIGASREEVLEVVRNSGISARRIAEFLISKQLTEPHTN
jgi:hypothetical protein